MNAVQIEPTSYPKVTKGRGLFWAASLLVAAMAWAAGLARMWFGFDIYDEAWYVAIAYRFLLGDRPFFDEITFVQGSFVLTLPLYRLWFAWANSPDSIFLFSRLVFYGFWTTCAGVLFMGTRRQIGKEVALALALGWLTYIPFLIPNVSYNTFGVGFLLLSCTLGFLAYFDSDCLRRRLHLIFQFGSLGCAVVSYPPLVAISPVFLLGVILRDQACMPSGSLTSSGSRRELLFDLGLAAVAIAAVPGGVVVAHADDVVYFAKTVGKLNILVGNQGGGFTKLYWVVRTVLGAWSRFWPLTVFMAVSYLIARLYRRALPMLVGILLIVAAAWTHPSIPKSLGQGVKIALLVVLIEIPIAALFRRNRVAVAAFFFYCLPAAAAGLVFAWASDNGVWASGLPLFVGLLGALLALAAGSGTVGIDTSNPASPHDLAMALLPILLLVGINVRDQWTVCFWHEMGPLQLDYVMGPGPFRGMRTFRARGELLTRLSQDLSRARAAIGNPPGNLLVLDGFPAAYLMTDSRPGSPTLYIAPAGHLAPSPLRRQFEVNHYRHRFTERDIVVLNKNLEDYRSYRGYLWRDEKSREFPYLGTGDPFIPEVDKLVAAGFRPMTSSEVSNYVVLTPPLSSETVR